MKQKFQEKNRQCKGTKQDIIRGFRTDQIRQKKWSVNSNICHWKLLNQENEKKEEEKEKKA